MNSFEAEQEARQDAVAASILIDESNLAAHFNEYENCQLAKLIIEGKKFIRLKDGISDRVVAIEDAHIQIADDNEFTIKLINASINGDSSIELVRSMIDAEVTRIIELQVCKIESDYQDLLMGDL